MLTALALGLVVGIILALTGAGGGILAVPLLVFGIQMSVAQAGPVGLLAVGMAAALGAMLGLRQGIVRYRAALMMAAAGMLFSPAGVWLAQRMDNRWLSILFAATLLLVAIRTFLLALRGAAGDVGDGAARRACERNASSGRFIWNRSCVRMLALAGGVAGLLSGLLGVGADLSWCPRCNAIPTWPWRRWWPLRWR